MCVCAHPAEVRSTLNWGFRLFVKQIEVGRSTGEFQCTWTVSLEDSEEYESMPNFFSLRLLSLDSKNQTRVKYEYQKVFICLNFQVSSGFKSPSKATHYEWLDTTTTTFRIGKLSLLVYYIFFPFKCFRTSKNEHIQEQTAQSSIIVKHNSIRHQGPFIKRLTNDVVEEEIEGNLKQVDDTLNSIKHLAIDMNVQLSIQEPKLDRIHQLSNLYITIYKNSDIAMDGANERVKKLLDE
uniref:t-SNARE coiled-coil homology domain-containing protein n=1 Tax=Heterorhabditis bacteriophora TaxID=37862 RepID=A0A1I7WRF8_HETBA